MIERKKKWKRMSQKKLCSCQMGVTQFVHSNRTMTKLTWLENQIWKNVICWVSPSVMGESLIPPLSNIIHSQMAFMIHRSTYLVLLPLIFSTCTLPFTLLPLSSSASNLAITKYQILKNGESCMSSLWMFLISLNPLLASVKPTALTTPGASKFTCAMKQFKGGLLIWRKQR